MHKRLNHELKEINSILGNIEEDTALEYAIWTKDKAKIKFENQYPSFPITSNYIYWCNLGINIGSEQNNIRPVLIVKTKRNSQICTILPLTTKRLNDTRWYHIDLEKQDSTILIEQLKNVSKLRIIKPHRSKGKLTKITQTDWTLINEALKKYYVLTRLQ